MMRKPQNILVIVVLGFAFWWWTNQSSTPSPQEQLTDNIPANSSTTLTDLDIGQSEGAQEALEQVYPPVTSDPLYEHKIEACILTLQEDLQRGGYRDIRIVSSVLSPSDRLAPEHGETTAKIVWVAQRLEALTTHTASCAISQDSQVLTFSPL